MTTLGKLLSLAIRLLSKAVVGVGVDVVRQTASPPPDNTCCQRADNTRDNTHLQVNYDENYRWN